MRENINYSEN